MFWLRVRSRDRQKPPTGEGAGEDGDEVLGGGADERKSVETNKQTTCIEVTSPTIRRCKNQEDYLVETTMFHKQLSCSPEPIMYRNTAQNWASRQQLEEETAFCEETTFTPARDSDYGYGKIDRRNNNW